MQVESKLKEAFPNLEPEVAAVASGDAARTPTKSGDSDHKRLVQLNQALRKVVQRELPRREVPWAGGMVQTAQDDAFPMEGLSITMVNRTGGWSGRQGSSGPDMELGFHVDLSSSLAIRQGSVYSVLMHDGTPGLEPGCTCLKDAHKELILVTGFGVRGGAEKPLALGVWVTQENNSSVILTDALKKNASDHGTFGGQRFVMMNQTDGGPHSYLSPDFVFNTEHHIEESHHTGGRHRDISVGLVGNNVDSVESRFLCDEYTLVHNLTYEARTYIQSDSSTPEVMLPYWLDDNTAILTPMVLSSTELLQAASFQLQGMHVSALMSLIVLTPFHNFWETKVITEAQSFLNIEPLVLTGVPFPVVANIALDTVCTYGAIAPGTRTWTFSFPTCSDLASALEITLHDARGNRLKFLQHSVTMVYDHRAPGVVTFRIGAASTVITSPGRSV